MTYERFKTDLFDSLREELGDEVHISSEELSCPGVSSRDAYSISIPGSSFMPVFFPVDYYKRYSEGSSIHEIVENIKDSIRYTSEDCLERAEVEDYSRAKSHIVPRLISYERNWEGLDHRLFIPYLDLAIVFNYVIKAEGNEIVSFAVTDDKLAEWGLSIEQLYQDSLTTSARLFPYMIESIEDLLALSGDEGDYNTFFVLSNSKRQYGAACLLYSSVLEQFAAQIGGGFYVIPSSVHEVLLIPEKLGIGPDELKEMLSDVNDSIVKPEEVLSYELYYYDASLGSLSTVH